MNIALNQGNNPQIQQCNLTLAELFGQGAPDCDRATVNCAAPAVQSSHRCVSPPPPPLSLDEPAVLETESLFMGGQDPDTVSLASVTAVCTNVSNKRREALVHSAGTQQTHSTAATWMRNLCGPIGITIR